MIDTIMSFFGVVPPDYEAIAYSGAVIVAGAVLILAVALVYSVFARVLRGW